ncbi:MerR family transcriptional regulator [Paenibacillus sp. N1-5-1-14]|uniref:MerR family transcriptional regulator n=1 Tax=Paenibacillus radicibacter TaxID=2972488 RepID=UPI002158CE1B|nr:MerR family transcriptional regulator [Paenibacillus radicibacter]MCR8642760.1 MerR family transcriptional regulator [Paenibacillus radicibacter]
MTWLKIDEVAQRSGLTKRTIRYYEEIGLLSPPERSEKGIRLYTEAHIDHLLKITNAREVLGFSLQEIQEFISISDALETHRKGYWSIEDQKEKLAKLQEIDHVISDQLVLIEQKIEKIHAVQSELQALRTRARTAIARYEQE